MSFPLFENFFELPSECSSWSVGTIDTNSGPEVEGGTETLHKSSIDAEEESDVSFHETMSLDSNTLQDFGSIVSLPAGMLAGLVERHWREIEGSVGTAGEEYSRSTILSSIPSGAATHIPQPTGSQDMWAVSPHPNLLSADLQGLSTVFTDSVSYQRLLPGDSASVVSSSQHEKEDVSALVPSSRNSRVHERAALEAIANQLLIDVVGNSPSAKPEVPSGPWYGRFTDEDWDKLREVAKALLDASSALRPKMLLPLPPLPPEHTYEDYDRSLFYDQSESRSAFVRVQDVVSPSLICPYCNQIIVGALTLDCGRTVCTICWEERQLLSVGPNKETEVEGYVWVNEGNCSQRGSVARTGIPCPALDVAICQVVDNLEANETNSNIQRIKTNYYRRLEAWRAVVMSRNERAAERQAIEEDAMLARLIEEEEELLWNKKESQLQKTFPAMNGFWLVLCQTAVAVLAGTISSVAIHTLAKRR